MSSESHSRLGRTPRIGRLIQPGEAGGTERRPYSRTGLNSLKARVKVRGLQAIDQRTAGAQELIAWRGQLIADLGGEEDLTAAKRALIDAATQTWLYISCVDAYLLEQRSLVNQRRRCLLPVVRERQQLVDSLARILGQLGLDRRARKNSRPPGVRARPLRVE